MGVGGRLQNFSTYKLPPKNQPGQNFKVQIHVSEATQCKNNCVFLRGEGVGGQQAHTAIKTWALKHTGGENNACCLLGHILESTKSKTNKKKHNLESIFHGAMKKLESQTNPKRKQKQINISNSWNQNGNKSEG